MAAFGSIAISCLPSLSRNKSFFFLSKTPSFSKPFFINPSLQKPRFSISFCLTESGGLEREKQRERGRQEEEEEKYRVVTAVRSNYNQIVIVDSASSRYLLLDSTHNVHSVINKRGQNWTGSYWDEFASLPAIIPKGPIAFYGLGGGTAVRLMLELWPSLQLEGWEIDGILIEKARDYLGLSDLEKPTQEGGRLCVRVDDALSPSQDASGSYAGEVSRPSGLTSIWFMPSYTDSHNMTGIIVDLFSDGEVLTQLQEVPTWLELGSRLMPNGRIMVNCGGIKAESDASNRKSQLDLDESTWILNSTIKSLSEAFPGQVCWKRTPFSQGLNFLALTGGLPDLTAWSNEVPVRLSVAVKQWKLCQPVPS